MRLGTMLYGAVCVIAAFGAMLTLTTHLLIEQTPMPRPMSRIAPTRSVGTKLDRKPVDSVVFVKTYKVAGGTLRRILEKVAQRRDLKIVPSNEAHPFSVTAAHARTLNGTYHMLTKHAKYGRWMKKLIPNGVFITMVREPLERAMSHYDHFNERAATTSFEDFYTNIFIKEKKEQTDEQSGALKHRDNMMALFLGYDTPQQISVKSLSTRYAFIGIKEHFNESMVMLSHVLNWKIKSMEYTYQHFNPKRRKAVPSDSLKQLFRERNQMDYRIYELSIKIFNSKLKSYPNIEKETKEYRANLEKNAREVKILKKLKNRRK